MGTRKKDDSPLPDGQPLCVSSITGEGVKEVWRIVLDACEEKVDEWRGDDEEEDDDEDGDGMEEYDGDTIQLDSRGEWIDAEGGEEELEYDQGYEWVQNYESDGYVNDDDDDDIYSNGYNDKSDDRGGDVADGFVNEDSKRSMAENEQMQARANEANTFKNLKKRVDQMQKDGSI